MVSIGQAEFHPSSSLFNLLNTSNMISYCKSESRQPWPPLQTSTVSIGQNEKIQRPELVGGHPLCATSVSTLCRGRVNHVQRPGPFEKSYVTKPTPNANITPLTVSMHSEVSRGGSVLENQQGTISNQVGNSSLYGSGFANLENDQFFTSVSSSASAKFHVAYILPDTSCGFSTFATANSGTYCTYSNSNFSAANVRNDTSSIFQPLYQDSYAQLENQFAVNTQLVHLVAIN